MPTALVITSETVGRATAGPGLRAAGLAWGLAQAGVTTTLVATTGSSAPAGVALGDRGCLAGLVAAVDVVIIPPALLADHPEALRARRLVADFAGPYPLEARVGGAPPDVVRAAERSAAYALGQADLVLCSQPRQVDYAVGLAASHGVALDAAAVMVVPFGVPLGDPRAPAERPAGPLRAVWPGGLWDWLDPLIALDALGRCTADVRMELWGAQSPDPAAPRMAMAERLRRRIDELGLGERALLVDWVPGDVYNERLAGFDLAVTFDLAGEEAAHAFRTRLLHALWLGVPTLATAGEHVADAAAAAGAGWTVPPHDPAAIAAAFDRLAADRSALAAARGRAQALAADADYRRIAEPLAARIREGLPARAHRTGRLPLGLRLRRVVRERLR